MSVTVTSRFPWQLSQSITSSIVFLDAFEQEVRTLLQKATDWITETFTIVSRPSPILGGVLRFRVQGISTETLEKVYEISKTRSPVACSWMANEAVYLRVGFEHWLTTKIDRLTNSRVLSVGNIEPLSSWRHVSSLN